MKISRRAATTKDIGFMLELRRTTMNGHLQAAGMCTSAESHMRRILLAFQSAQVLEMAGKPVGILKVTRQGAVWELIQIQLVPDLQGHGIGSSLIEELLPEAERANASVRLSVLKSSPALRLYECLGFEAKDEDERFFHLANHAGAQSALRSGEQIARQG
jgi:ribosomal protein S18 acetylase RimI-like enzyme